MKLFDAMELEAQLPDGTRETFTFQQYLDYRDWVGLPVEDSEKTDHITWLKADNLSRLAIYVSLELYNRAKKDGR